METQTRASLRDYIATFERDGFVHIPEAIPSERLTDMQQAHDRMYEVERAAGALDAAGAMHTFAFIARDPVFEELLDLEATFPLVVRLLGTNIYMYHCHIDAVPPLKEPRPPRWGWHQDGTKQNTDLETDPRPRLSVKVAFFMSDASEPGSGNMLVIPGSHLHNTLARPAEGESIEPPPGAVPVLALSGDAVIFDRRVWHSRSDNHASETRKAMFLAYTYRWISPRDDPPYDPDWVAGLPPVRRQLMGASSGNLARWIPDDSEIPVGALLQSSRWLRRYGNSAGS